ncbi:MAG: Ig-like domain-containing protein, partial [Mycobacteriaceae bacterium]|nr:Ig-like domain-containing protein [Mycobacteriaceae bacterium]
RVGNQIVALFGFTQEGLYQLRIGGSGASAGNYQLRMAAAGDLDLDGDVDGTDSAAFNAAAPGSDITGDGARNGEDRSVLFSNFGFAQNQGPIIATTLPAVLTHEELPVMVELASIAADPNGDQVFYRIISATHGTAALSADARYVIFTPDAGYAGTASFQLKADDGFNESALAMIGVTVSDADLIRLDFAQRHILMDTGASISVQAIGDFADQADVLLPLWYVNGRILNTSIASLTPQGVLTAQANGHTVLIAGRDAALAATVVGVGSPTGSELFVSRTLGIDAYPDSVALVPNGGTRQIVTTLGVGRQIYITEASNGTLYFSGNSDIATVTANGLIQAHAEGETTVTAIYGYAEDIVRVKVDAPLSQNGTAVVGAEGGVITTAGGGVVAAFGPDQLTDGTTVTLQAVSLANLPLALPTNPAGQTTMTYLGAFDLGIEGGELTGPIQAAVRVAPGSAVAGDQVYFLQKANLPVGPNGEWIDVWNVVDSGVVGTDGMARTSSPPFPGLSGRGSVLVAKMNQPAGVIHIDIGYITSLSIAFSIATGIAATGGLAGAVVAGGMIAGYVGMLALPAL